MDYSNVEVWRDVPGYIGIYQVSNVGRVKSMNRKIKQITKLGRYSYWNIKGRILKNIVSKSGYDYINMCKNGKRRAKKVHQLVLEAFVGKCPEGMVCCHYDGNSSNNRLENLRWDTTKNNYEDSRRHGTNSEGERCGGSKLKVKEVKLIKKLLNCNVEQSIISKMFRIGQTAISSIKTGFTWKTVEAYK